MDYFAILNGKVKGKGNFKGKNFNLKGDCDVMEDEVTIKRVDEGNETELIYKGHINNDLDKIRTRKILVDGT